VSDDASAPAAAAAALTAVNRRFYDRLWGGSRLLPPERFSTWPLVSGLAAQAPARLEIGPGLRPRLPLAGTRFIDLSPAAVARLAAAGGQAEVGSALELPATARSIDLLCALDVVEHVVDDARVFGELERVLAADGTLLLSAPLFAARWTPFDAICGHHRRYEPDELRARLAAHGLRIVQSAAYGMQPRQWLVDLGLWFMKWMPRRAMFFYNLGLPLALRLQPPLALRAGDAALDGIADEVLLVCRRSAG
jgi:SAM-dependent methyltransferase